MHVLTYKRIKEFSSRHPQSRVPLSRWYKRMNKSSPHSVNDIKRLFVSADYIGNDRFVFNISGNKYRLVALINFCKQKVYVRFIGTLGEYSNTNIREI